jgi:peptidoglycan/xylan/chitin deacetylase (PgdA/CDA1 family)
MRLKHRVIRAGFEALYLSGAYTLLRPVLGGVGAILMLHRVRPPGRDLFQPNKPLEVTPDFLECVIHRLRRENIDLISLDEMHRRLTERDFGRRFACVTFDDGYRDNKQWAYPLLKHEGVPFCVYVVKDFAHRVGKLWWLAIERVIARNTRVVLVMGGRKTHLECADLGAKLEVFEKLHCWLRNVPSQQGFSTTVDDLAARYGIDMPALCAEHCMDWSEIGELACDPLATIGTHTVSHPMLAKASEAEVRAELKMSRAVIEAVLGTAPTHLAYPYGDPTAAGAREFRIAAELGFKTAVTTRPGVLFARHADYLTALPRLSLNGCYQDIRYAAVLMSGAATAMWNGVKPVERINWPGVKDAG